MLSLLVLLSVLLMVKGHNHEIVILYDSSPSIASSECENQINGILSYYNTYHDMNVGNVLSFITFNSSSIDIVTGFNDEYKKGVSFNDLSIRIKAATCNYNDDDMHKTEGGDAYLAIKSVITSMFNHKNKDYMNDKTPRILLFSNYRSMTSSEIDVCAFYYSYLSKHRDIDFSTTVVNFHSDNYLRCLAADKIISRNPILNGAKTYISFVSDINGNTKLEDKFAYYQNDIIYSVCSAVCLGDGAVCSLNVECCSNDCDGGECDGDGCKPEGELCTDGDECCSDFCDFTATTGGSGTPQPPTVRRRLVQTTGICGNEDNIQGNEAADIECPDDFRLFTAATECECYASESFIAQCVSAGAGCIRYTFDGDEICAPRPVGDCDPNPCLNGASCTTADDTYSCGVCPMGFEGINCDQAAECPEVASQFVAASTPCDCYEGEFLSMCAAENDCMMVYDEEDGICASTVPPGVAAGECPEDSLFDAASTPCRCYEEEFVSECPSADFDRCVTFTSDGDQMCASRPIGDCDPDPCVNGLCVTDGSKYGCVCSTGFAGILCNEIAEEVEAAEAGEPGECPKIPPTIADDDGTTPCECYEDGFIDRCPTLRCALYTDEGDKICAAFRFGDCASNLCLNGASCSTPAVANTYSCECADGFEGINCEEEVEIEAVEPGDCPNIPDASTPCKCYAETLINQCPGVGCALVYIEGGQICASTVPPIGGDADGTSSSARVVGGSNSVESHPILEHGNDGDDLGMNTESEGDIDYDITINLSHTSLVNLWISVIVFVLINLTLYWCFCRKHRKQQIFSEPDNKNGPLP